MPGFDGTGPVGRGPITGGGFGYCAGYASELETSGRPFYGRCGVRRVFGRGKGFGFGRGCFRPGYFGAAFSHEDEKAMIENRLRRLENESDQLKQRLAELDESST